MQSIIQQKLVNTTIGGTSAGEAILGNWIYSAEAGSATSDVVLLNPYDPTVTVVPQLFEIPYMDTVIMDQHFGRYDMSI